MTQEQKAIIVEQTVDRNSIDELIFDRIATAYEKTTQGRHTLRQGYELVGQNLTINEDGEAVVTLTYEQLPVMVGGNWDV